MVRGTPTWRLLREWVGRRAVLVAESGQLYCPRALSLQVTRRGLALKRARQAEPGLWSIPLVGPVEPVTPTVLALPERHPSARWAGESVTKAIAAADPVFEPLRWFGGWFLAAIAGEEGVVLVTPDYWLARRVEAFEQLAALVAAQERQEGAGAAPQELPHLGTALIVGPDWRGSWPVH